MAAKADIRVTFVGLGADQKPPATALFRLDPNGVPVEKLATIDGGSFALDTDTLKGAQIGLGPDTADAASVDPASLLRFRADQVLNDWQRSGILIPQDRWPQLFSETICVAGHVRKCRPWWYDLVVARPLASKIGVQLRAHPTQFADLSLTNIRLPWRCLTVCEGTVEIYERVCCCSPIIWDDLVAKLHDVLREIPAEINWPVPPIPDPGPLTGPLISRLRFPSSTAPQLRQLQLQRPQRQDKQLATPVVTRDIAMTTVSARLYEDYQALLKQPRDSVDAFVAARPYLSAYVCSCGIRKVGETPIGPGGQFHLCYRRPRTFHRVGQHCYTTFAYRVRQQIGGVETVIYDGVAGHDYFAQGDDADLRTASPLARPCGDGPPPPDPGDGLPFVMLEHVTGAGTHHFQFPAQTALSQTGPLGTSSGLLDFGGAVDCPWATSLGLRLWFSPALEGTVSFYRLKVFAVDPNGTPTGSPVILSDPVSWQRFVVVAGDVIVTSTGLNATPSDVGGQEGLIAAPYWSNGMDWLSGQYHQTWDTTRFADGKYMLVLELFGPGGIRIKPNGAPASDPGTAHAFQIRRWHAPGDTDDVPFADAAHIFWINNRSVVGDIVDLRKNGVSSTDECQFMSGPGDTTFFSVGFMAYHLDGVTTGGGSGDTDSFMHSYALTWQRGLNGPSGTLETGAADKGELGTAQSNALAFSFLLGAFPPSTAHTRCSFSVHLHVDAKHHNGGAFIDSYDYDETASFALELAP